MVKWSLRYKQVLFHALNKYWLDTDFYSTISGAVGHRGGLVRQALVVYRNRWTGKTQNKGGRRKKQDVDDLAWAQHGADSPQWSSDPPAGVPTSRLQPGTCCQISSGIRWEIKGGGWWFQGDLSTLHLLCHLPHLRSWKNCLPWNWSWCQKNVGDHCIAQIPFILSQHHGQKVETLLGIADFFLARLLLCGSKFYQIDTF